jgi:hypothetical protein
VEQVCGIDGRTLLGHRPPRPRGRILESAHIAPCLRSCGSAASGPARASLFLTSSSSPIVKICGADLVSGALLTCPRISTVLITTAAVSYAHVSSSHSSFSTKGAGIWRLLAKGVLQSADACLQSCDALADQDSPFCPCDKFRPQGHCGRRQHG